MKNEKQTNEETTKKEEVLKCDICNKEHDRNIVNINYDSKDQNEYICLFCKHKKFKDNFELITEEHNNQENALIVENYPYGFKRTKIRYWIETTKRGDRLNTQTLNPKTNLWNKPKKSTYDEVKVLIKQKSNGHIKTYSWNYFSVKEGLYLFKEFTQEKNYKFNPLQIEKMKEGNAVYKTRKYINYECKAVEYRNKETGEIVTSIPIFEMDKYEKVEDLKEEEEQQKARQNIGKLHAIHLKQEGL